MNILLLGSGGREHALAWKMAQSKLTKKLYIAPGNGGTEEVGENISLNISNFEETKSFLISKKISMVVVGPEQPLVDGFADKLANDSELNHINVIGPKKIGATLEGSKDFSKQFMFRNGVPTAAYQSFTKSTLNEGLAFLETLKSPYVLKADGLAAGKGVLILDDLAEAKQELTSMFEGKFGEASNTVVIEEFLDGIELSVFVVTDGKDYVILPEAKDYKRIGEGDKGLNTGGMGAVSPVPFAKGAFLQKVEEKVIKPTINGLAKDGIEYKGFIFFGLIKVNNEPFVIEYNVRMGDPETEVVIPRIKSDLVALFDACGKGTLNNYKLEVMDETALTIVAVSGGYPGSYEKGKLISGIRDAQAGIYFHAGTKSDGDDLLTSGGRVIACTGFGNTLVKAKNNALTMVNSLRYQGKYYRKDIGNDLEGLI
jgi:phosphoribosylamine---glycine ligase